MYSPLKSLHGEKQKKNFYALATSCILFNAPKFA